MGGGVDQGVAQIGVDAEDLTGQFFAHQVDFVGNDGGGDALFLGDDQKAVEHAQARLGIGAGKDQHDLVNVGEQDLAVFAFRAGIHADERALPGFDGFDAAGAVG